MVKSCVGGNVGRARPRCSGDRQLSKRNTDEERVQACPISEYSYPIRDGILELIPLGAKGKRSGET